MKKALKLVISITVCFAIVFGLTPVFASQGGEAPDATFTYNLPSYLSDLFTVTSKVENGRTIINIHNKLGNVDLDTQSIEKILAQRAGAGSTKFSVYGTLNVNLNQSGIYGQMKYRGNRDEWSINGLETIAADTKPTAKALNFNFWPYLMKLVYRVDENSPWTYVYEATDVQETLKTKLAKVLNIAESEVVSKYNVLYRFEPVASGRVDTNRFDFYKDKAGTTPNLNDVSTLELLGTEYFEIHYTSEVEVESITLVENAKTLDINETYQLVPTIAPINTPYQKVTYSSSNKDVATVNSNGVVTAIKEGVATITASSEKKSTTVTITVTNNVVVENALPNNAETIIQNANEKVNFQLYAPIEISENILQKAKESNKDIEISMMNEGTGDVMYSWIFEANSIQQIMPVKLEIIMGEEKPSELTGKMPNGKNFFLRFNHEGALPGNTKVKINVKGIYEDGELVNFYYYNPTTQKYEKIQEKLKVQDGYIIAEVSHCSDYILAPYANNVEQTKVPNPDTGMERTIPAIGMITILAMGVIGIIKKIV